MLLKLIRNPEYSNPMQTVGVLYINGIAVCNTIEPPVQGNTTHPKGCIPMGWYPVQVTQSPKFHRLLPLILQVPGFNGIRIHAGTKVEHTKGCICVGSRNMEDQITKKLLNAQNRYEAIYIDITDPHRNAVELPH